MEEIKNLHKEWFPIDYDDNYFKKIFVNKYNTYFSIGAFYTLENNKEIIIGLAFCEYRGVTDYFIKHTVSALCRLLNLVLAPQCAKAHYILPFGLFSTENQS